MKVWCFLGSHEQTAAHFWFCYVSCLDTNCINLAFSLEMLTTINLCQHTNDRGNQPFHQKAGC